MTLNNFTVTNESIEFDGVTTSGTKFTNINASDQAIVSFVNLSIGLTIFNKNTSVNEFTSVAGSQSFNVTILAHNEIILNSFITVPTNNCLEVTNLLTGGFVTFTQVAVSTFLVMLAVFILIVIILIKDQAGVKEAERAFTAFMILSLIVLLGVIIFGFLSLAC